MSENMVERVARALYEESSSPASGFKPWSKLRDDMRDNFRARARAAIEATREPTPDMIHFGHGHWKDGKGSIAIYQAMITAALKP